jgi:hypothetical protein
MARSEWKKLKDFDLIASVFLTFAIYKRLSISDDESYIYLAKDISKVLQVGVIIYC